MLGIWILYVPMVSTTYQKLYAAYCSADAVAEVLSRRVGATSFATGEYDGCRDDTRKTRRMTKSDVFFLIDGLGLRDAKERSVNDMFLPSAPKSKDGLLAALLIRDDVYTLGMSTMELSIRLAGKLGAGGDVTAGSDEPAAAYVVCRIAGLSAIAAQQPYLGAIAKWRSGDLSCFPAGSSPFSRR